MGWNEKVLQWFNCPCQNIQIPIGRIHAFFGDAIPNVRKMLLKSTKMRQDKKIMIYRGLIRRSKINSSSSRFKKENFIEFHEHRESRLMNNGNTHIHKIVFKAGENIEGYVFCESM